MNKAIKCPDCAHLAILYVYPNQYAGIWECQNPKCGASDNHEHDDVQLISVEVASIGSDGEYAGREEQAYQCQTCGLQVDGDPAEDRADAIADSQIMQALGK